MKEVHQCFAVVQADIPATRKAVLRVQGLGLIGLGVEGRRLVRFDTKAKLASQTRGNGEETE